MSMDPSEFVRGLLRANAQVHREATRAVDVFGEQLIGNAQQLTPVDTGFLQGSGTTTPAELKGATVEKVCGMNSSYAAAVHENLTARHDVGGAKYLSRAMAWLRWKFSPFVANWIRRRTGG